MTEILRKCIHVCTGDLRYTYSLPNAVDEHLADFLGNVGSTRQINVKRGTIWSIESAQGIKLIIQSGNSKLDVRLRRKSFPANLKLLESHLLQYFPSTTIKEQ